MLCLVYYAEVLDLADKGPQMIARAPHEVAVNGDEVFFVGLLDGFLQICNVARETFHERLRLLAAQSGYADEADMVLAAGVS